MLNNFLGHFKTITIHKFKVMALCFRCGLYKQGLLHDLSKYSLTEFIPGVRFYQGYRSPISREKEVIGYSRGWLHHKGRNKHHFEYWIDSIQGEFQGVEMEIPYVIEMFCDRVVASQVYAKENYHDGYPLEYFLNNKAGYYLMHPNTMQLIESLFVRLKEKGLDQTIDYIRKEILRNK
ncbi:MAG: DUF5662 family protein [Beduini sp.]|uniref:DUF5662 family protein n=1 Tax=Beduini sp. TaxID=1922300 RepID=UPI0039A21D05